MLTLFAGALLVFACFSTVLQREPAGAIAMPGVRRVDRAPRRGLVADGGLRSAHGHAA